MNFWSFIYQVPYASYSRNFEKLETFANISKNMWYKLIIWIKYICMHAYYCTSIIYILIKDYGIYWQAFEWVGRSATVYFSQKLPKTSRETVCANICRFTKPKSSEAWTLVNLRVVNLLLPHSTQAWRNVLGPNFFMYDRCSLIKKWAYVALLILKESLILIIESNTTPGRKYLITSLIC